MNQQQLGSAILTIMAMLALISPMMLVATLLFMVVIFRLMIPTDIWNWLIEDEDEEEDEDDNE